MHQEIRFCTAPDGVRLAYATSGDGYPLVKAANWLNHLQFDWESPIWRHLFRELSRGQRLVRYDERGNGMSDWDAPDVSFDAWVSDLETVVDAAGLDRFALLGISQGGAVSIAYAARHPERVSHLVLLGAWARGWGRRDAVELRMREAMLTLMRDGWGQENPAFRQVWTSRFIPGGTLEQQRWYNELQRVTASPANAVRLSTTSRDVDISSMLPSISTPTLVLHARGDAVAPFELGRELALGIRGAQFVPLDSGNHLLLEEEPAFQVFVAEVRRFLGVRLTVDAGAQPSTSGLPAPGVGPGTLLGRYEIVAKIGAGGMGLVFEAVDTQLQRRVAIKVLARTDDLGDEARRRLLREARHAAALNHPGICTIHEVAESHGVDYLVMELVIGRPLSVVAPPAGLPVSEIRSYGIQVADALAHAHGHGIVHGDLKAANVMVRDDGRVKVLDFGISRRTTQTSTTTIAGPSVIAGTPAYMAPEVLQGQTPGPRSDIWALGVLLFEMATGRLPFNGRGMDVVVSILRDEPQFSSARLPKALRRLIEKCLAKEPARRYATAAEVSSALVAVADADLPILGGMFDR